MMSLFFGHTNLQTATQKWNHLKSSIDHRVKIELTYAVFFAKFRVNLSFPVHRMLIGGLKKAKGTKPCFQSPITQSPRIVDNRVIMHKNILPLITTFKSSHKRELKC